METMNPGPNAPLNPQKKGLGTGAMIGIGCGGIVALVVLAFIVFGVMYGGKLKQFAEEAQKDPTRATANMMVTASGGTMEIVAQDEVGKRYTVKEKKSGKLTTIYWDEKKKAPGVVVGDFSAIPADPAPAAAAPESAPAPEAGAK